MKLAYELVFKCKLFIIVARFTFISIFRLDIAIFSVLYCELASFFAIIILPGSIRII